MSATPTSRNFISVETCLLTKRLMRSAAISLRAVLRKDMVFKCSTRFYRNLKAPAVAACNSLYVRYIKENINSAAFPCKLLKGVSTWWGREED